MRLTVVNGLEGAHQRWRGGLVIRGNAGTVGALIDPNAAVSTRVLLDDALRHRCGLDRPTLPVLLTQASLDQLSALIELRHGNPIDLYATPTTFDTLRSSSDLWPALQGDCTMHWCMVPQSAEYGMTSFRVDGQHGVSYRVIPGETDPDVPDGHRCPQPLVIADDTGAQAVWIPQWRADPAWLDFLIDVLAPVQTVVLPLAWAAPEACLHWLAQQVPAHKVVLGAPPALQRAFEQAGLEWAVDGMDWVVE